MKYYVNLEMRCLLFIMFLFFVFSITAVAGDIEDNNLDESFEFSYDESTTSSQVMDEIDEQDTEDLINFPNEFEQMESEQKAAKAVWCQCVTYIQNRYGMSCSVNAKDMGSCLKQKGFNKLSSPRAGAVVIFQPAYSATINQAAGHIGVIKKVSYNSKTKTYTLEVRGANQGGTTFTEYGCNNVSNGINTTYTVGSNKAKNISFYAK